MSDFTILRTAALALRDELFRALTTVPDVDFDFDNVETDIVLSAPDSAVPNTARLSVYLYHIEPDPQLRNQPPLSQGPDRLVRAPLALRGFFLITPLLDDESDSHQMLGRIMQALHDDPFIDQVDGAPLGDSLGGGSRELRISFEPMSLEEISRIWHAMGSDYRLSIAYSMRTVLIDSALDPVQIGRVDEAHIGVGQLA